MFVELERPVVAVRGLEKTFAGTRALRGVDLEFRAGEIHAICGGNGSGKSTLIKILTGVYDGDEGGVIQFGGESVPAQQVSPAISHRAGIRVVHQDLAVFPDLTVAENLSIDRALTHGPAANIRWREVNGTAARLIREFEIPATPRTPLRDLSLAARTQVAIARSLRDRRSGGTGGLLILDEPTAALPVHEVDTLHVALKRLADQGQSILYVSHRLDEVLSLADRVSILRDGRLEGTYATSEMDESSLIVRMLGRSVETSLETHEQPTIGEPVLTVQNLVCGPLSGASLEIRAGEVVGIAGLMGSGRSTLLRCIFGDIRQASGGITLGTETGPTSVAAAVRSGIAMVPEHRTRDAAFLDHSLSMNLSIGQIARYWSRMFIRDRSLRRDSDRLVREYGVKAVSAAPLMASLSGGNQQKVVIARWLRRNPRILLLDEPTQGVDVGARADIYRIIREAARNGAAALVVASDFEELALVVDRALVLRGGKVVAEVPRTELSATRLAELSYSDAT